MPLAGAAVPLDPASYPARGAELKLQATENAVRAKVAQSRAVLKSVSARPGIVNFALPIGQEGPSRGPPRCKRV